MAKGAVTRLALGLLVGATVACGGSRAGDAAGGDKAAFRVGLITPGSITDAAWNSGAYKGLEAIRDSLGAKVSHVEARTPAAQEEALRAYASQGYQLVLAHGYEFQQMAEQVSREFPATAFVVTSGARGAERVAPLIFRLEDATYLAGMVAGVLTKTNTIGFVGGVELPPVKAAYEGWVAGAKAVNPKVQARVTYLNNWDDAAAGREAAIALMRVGVDVFHHNADAAALGVFQAAKETPNVAVIGANADQSALATDHVPGSAVIDLPHAFLLVAREVKDGTFQPTVHVYGLKENVVRWVANPAYPATYPAGFDARLAAAADSIKAGTLVPAARPAEMQAARTTAGAPRG